MSTSLNVPYKKQKAGNWCVPACLQMLMSYYGIEMEQKDIAQELGIEDISGVNLSQAADFLLERGITGKAIFHPLLSTAPKYSEILSALRSGRPVLAGMGQINETGHAILVYGCESESNDTVFYHNPNFKYWFGIRNKNKYQYLIHRGGWTQTFIPSENPMLAKNKIQKMLERKKKL